jgi:hypothetical protein
LNPLNPYGEHVMPKTKPVSLDALSVPERILLFCVASATEWERAGVTGSTVTVMIVRGLIERDAGGRLIPTKQGRATLTALLKQSEQA